MELTTPSGRTTRSDEQPESRRLPPKGQLQPNHFTADDFAAKDDLEAQLLLCLEKMRADATWMALAPTTAEWASLPLSVKIALAALYERVCAQEFLRKVQVELPGLHLPT